MRNGSVTPIPTLVLGLALIAVTSAAPLPDGNTGIAARYPFDAGIASDLPSSLPMTSNPTAAQRA